MISLTCNVLAGRAHHFNDPAGVCPVTLHLTKRDCYQAGHTWTGFDASGHTFLLSWNNLFMLEEFAVSCQQTSSVSPQHRWAPLEKYLQILSRFLCLLMFLGEIMMIFTSLYFHTFAEKIIGIGCGLSSWYFLYKFLYPKIFSQTNPRD